MWLWVLGMHYAGSALCSAVCIKPGLKVKTLQEHLVQTKENEFSASYPKTFQRANINKKIDLLFFPESSEAKIRAVNAS